ncbi:MAG: replication protein RepA [Candidatus Aenigmatarchaeota archaeon]
MEDEQDQRRRAPAEFKKVGNLGGDENRVSLIGTAVDVTEGAAVIDDGTGKVEVTFDLSKDLSKFEEGNLVRVIGRPTGDSLEGEVIQDFEGFDLDLYEDALEKLEEVRE